MEKITTSRWFSFISWGITTLIVLGSVAFAFWRLQGPTTAYAQVPAATLQPATTQAAAHAQNDPSTDFFTIDAPAIYRKLTLKTIIPADRPRTDVVDYKVVHGDSLFEIANQFGLKPESVLWANFDILQDDPNSLRPGQTLKIPPTDGILYQWKEGDTVDKVAAKYYAKPSDIMNWPGNITDLTNPTFTVGQTVMIPGGWRESSAWIQPVAAVGHSGTANVGTSVCSTTPVSTGGFIWPANNHYLSGNDYSPTHRGIDIAAGEGAPIYAADSGVVVKADGGYNAGYGNVIMIDHGNGYETLYAHLSQINVQLCQSVSQGQLIGLAGATGNAFGAHLHFEVRLNGGFVDPWYVLP